MGVATFMYMRLIGYAADKISILTTYNGQKHLIRDVVNARCANNPLIGILTRLLPWTNIRVNKMITFYCLWFVLKILDICEMYDVWWWPCPELDWASMFLPV